VHKIERSGPGGGGDGGGGGQRAPAATPSAGGTGENYDQYGEEPF
jgi:hypothetical protein